MHRLLLPLILFILCVTARPAFANEFEELLDDRTGLLPAETQLVERWIDQFNDADARGALETGAALVKSLHDRGGPADRRGEALEALGNVLGRVQLLTKAIEHTEGAIRAYEELTDGKAAKSRATSQMAALRIRNGELDAGLQLDRRAVELAKEAYPDGHSDVIRAISYQAMRLASAGRYQAAIDAMNEAVAMARRCLPKRHPRLRKALSDHSGLLRRVGRHEEALQLEMEAIRLEQRDGGPDPGPGVELLHRGDGLLRTRGATAAIPVLEEAVSILDASLPASHPKLLAGLQGLATAYSQVGRTRDAVDELRRALAVFEDRSVPLGGTWLALRISLAGELVRTGELAEALELATDAVEISQAINPSPNRQLVGALSALGFAQGNAGRSELAVDTLSRAAEMLRALSAERTPDYGVVLASLANALARAGREDEASEVREEALRVASGHGAQGDQTMAGLLLSQAIQLRHRGDHEASITACERALEHAERGFGVEHPDTLNALDTLSRSYELAGRADDARRTLDSVIEMGRRLEWRYLYAALYRATTAALREERIEDAEALAEEGVLRFEGLLESARGLSTEGRVQALADLRRQAHPYKALAEVRLTQGRVADALEVLESGRSHTLLGLLAESREDPLRRAFAMAEERGDDALVRRIGDAEASVRAANARLVEAQRGEERARASRKLAEVRAARAEVTASRQAVADAVRARHFVLRDVLPAAKPRTVEEIRSLLGPTERMLVLFRGDGWVWSFLVRPPGADVPVHVWRSEFDAADVERYVNALATKGGIDTPLHRKTGGLLFSRLVSDTAWKELEGASRVFVSPHDDLNRLPFEALVVGSDRDGPRYWLDDGPPISYVASGSVLAWLRERRTTSDQLGTGLVAVGDPEFEAKSVHWPRVGVLVVEVEEEGQAARLGLRVGDVIARYGRTSVSARDALEKAEQAPGAEGKTPLQIYRDGAPQTLQADGGALGVQVADEPPHVSGPKLIEAARAEVGGTERAGRLQRLPGTAKEVRAIRVVAKRLGDELPVTTILGAEAHEARVFEAARGCRILHVATHGLVSEKQSASFSALALAPPAVPVPGNDGFLSLGDLLERWRGHLDGCELVVLSACESQRGTLDRHEGMLALPWGFCFAGSPTVVGSLWKVDDASTAELMKAFYESLLGPDSPDKDHSLHAARRALRERFPDPYYWAPFVLLGDPVRDTDER